MVQEGTADLPDAIG